MTISHPSLPDLDSERTSDRSDNRGKGIRKRISGMRFRNKVLLILAGGIFLYKCGGDAIDGCKEWMAERDDRNAENEAAKKQAEEREKEKPKDKLSLDVIVKINGLGDIEAQLQEANIKIDDCGDTHPFSISIFTTWEESAPDMARDTDAGTSEWTRKRKLSPMIIFQGHDSEIQYDSDEITATEDELKVGKLVKSVSFVRGTQN